MERIDKARIKSERAFKYAMLGPAVLWVIGFTFFPIFSAVNYSLANYVLGRGITGYVGLQNFVNVLSDGGFWYSLLITLIYVVVLSPTIAIQGSASVLGVHARSSGSPKDYVEPTYANA
jgi:ABC-type sugar transport system permease subunit